MGAELQKAKQQQQQQHQASNTNNPNQTSQNIKNQPSIENHQQKQKTQQKHATTSKDQDSQDPSIKSHIKIQQSDHLVEPIRRSTSRMDDEDEQINNKDEQIKKLHPDSQNHNVHQQFHNKPQLLSSIKIQNQNKSGGQNFNHRQSQSQKQSQKQRYQKIFNNWQEKNKIKKQFLSFRDQKEQKYSDQKEQNYSNQREQKQDKYHTHSAHKVKVQVIKEKPISKASKTSKDQKKNMNHLIIQKDKQKPTPTSTSTTTPTSKAKLPLPSLSFQSANTQNIQKDERNSTDQQQEDQEIKDFQQKLANVFQDQNKNKNKKDLKKNKMNIEIQEQQKLDQQSSSSQMDIEEYDLNVNEDQIEKMNDQQQQQEILPLEVIIQNDLASLQVGQIKSPSTGIYYQNQQEELQLQRFINKYGIDKKQILSRIDDLYKLQNIYIKNQSYIKNDPKLVENLGTNNNNISKYWQNEGQIPYSEDQFVQLKQNQPQNKIQQFYQYYPLKDFQHEIPKETYEIYKKLSKQIDSYGNPEITIQLSIVQENPKQNENKNKFTLPSLSLSVSNPLKVNNSQLSDKKQQQLQQKIPNKVIQISYKYKGNLIGKITDKATDFTNTYPLKSLIGLKLIIDHNFIRIDLIDMQKTTYQQNNYRFNIFSMKQTKYRAIVRLSLNYPKYHKVYGKILLKKYTSMIQNLPIEQCKSKEKLIQIFGKVVKTAYELTNVSNRYEKITQGQDYDQDQDQDQGQALEEQLKNKQNQSDKNISLMQNETFKNLIGLYRFQRECQIIERVSKIQKNLSSLSKGVYIGGSEDVIKQKQKEQKQKEQKQKQKEQKRSTLRQNIFDSQSQIGKFFDLTSTDIEQQSPSMLFKGKLKQYQKRALAWMLHRQQCPIYFEYGTNKYQHGWKLMPNTQNLYIHEPKFNQSLYIRPYPPIDRKIVRGGILADQMGLGKTIMSVALIATHIKKDINQKQRYQYHKNQTIKAGTLIVVPLAILNQWKRVFEQYLPNFKCLEFYGKKRNHKYDDIVRSQIVITTQSLLKNQRNTLAKEGNTLQNGKSLYHYEWFRIIIDESHSLRNQKCQYFIAAKQINARYRWLLTGTPLQNKLQDLQSLLFFLQYQPWSNLQFWKTHFKQSESISEKDLIKIKSIIKGIVVRRKKQSKDQDGNQILQITPHKSLNYEVYLPQNQYKKYIKISKSILNSVTKFQEQYDTYNNSRPYESMDVYNKNKKRTQFQKRINTLMLSTFEKLTKMRQFCCHPKLYHSRSKYITYQQFPRHFEKFLEFYEVSNKRRTIKQIKNSKSTLMQSYLYDQTVPYQSRKKRRQQLEQHALDLIMKNKPFFCAYGKCGKKIKSNRKGVISICLHFYCEKCFKFLFKNNSQIIKEEKQKKEPNKKVSKRKTLKCSSLGCQQQLFYNQVLSLPRNNRFGNKPIYNIQPNEKIQFIINYLNQSRNQQKVIVFTSFVGMVQLLIQAFKKQQINYLTMIGEDSYETRTKRLAAFKQNPFIKVFVISLKCGYAGLNLQMANKVIFCETWWNPAIQDQAIARLHRMGQQKQVQVVRLITKNTIQEQMHIINQEKKLKSDFVLDSDQNQGEKRNKRLAKVLLIKSMLLKSLQQSDLKSKKRNQNINEKQKNSRISSESSSDSSSSSQDYSSQEDADNEQMNYD